VSDIHDPDRYIGRYVTLAEDDESAAGFLVDVTDDVRYEPRPVRWVALDWGQGWPVSADTTITVAPEPPVEPEPDNVQNPIDVMHRAMHAGGDCTEGTHCIKSTYAYAALRAFRGWQERQSDRYWVHHYVDRVKASPDDDSLASNLIREAKSEGAPLAHHRPHAVPRGLAQEGAGVNEVYRSRRLAAREAEVVAEFLHPTTDAPMVTWYQTSTIGGEEPEFYSASKKEFLSWFELKRQS
jgi:hypothetical protein